MVLTVWLASVELATVSGPFIDPTALLTFGLLLVVLAAGLLLYWVGYKPLKSLFEQMRHLLENQVYAQQVLESAYSSVEAAARSVGDVSQQMRNQRSDAADDDLAAILAEIKGIHQSQKRLEDMQQANPDIGGEDAELSRLTARQLSRLKQRFSQHDFLAADIEPRLAALEQELQ